MKRGYLTNKEYDYVYSRSPRFCVDLLVVTGGSVLLAKRKESPYKGKWSIPGGRVRFRESILDAVQRIAKEEFGVGVTIINNLGTMEFLREQQHRGKRHSISMVYSVGFMKSSKVIYNSDQKFFRESSKYIHPIHLDFLQKNGFIV